MNRDKEGLKILAPLHGSRISQRVKELFLHARLHSGILLTFHSPLYSPNVYIFRLSPSVHFRNFHPATPALRSRASFPGPLGAYLVARILGPAHGSRRYFLMRGEDVAGLSFGARWFASSDRG